MNKYKLLYSKGAGINKEAIAEFEKEIDVMTTLRHDNIVSLLGICTETLPLFIIMGKTNINN